MTMAYHGYVMFLIAALEVMLAFYFVAKYRKTTSIRWYIVVILGIVGYVVSNAITYIQLDAPIYSHLLQWFSGVVVTAAFLLFAINFPYRRSSTDAFESMLFWVPVCIFFVLIFFSHQFITTLDYSVTPAKQNYGGSVLSFAAFFSLYWIMFVYILIRKLQHSDGIHHWQIRTFLFGAIALPLIASSVFDVFLPILGNVSYGWVGPEASIIWLGFTSYIILKK